MQRLQPNERRSLEAWKQYEPLMRQNNAKEAEIVLSHYDFEIQRKLPQIYARFARNGILNISDEDFIRQFRDISAF